MLYLKEANYEDIEKEYLFVRDIPMDENGLTNQWHGISREDFEEKAIGQMLAFAKGEKYKVEFGGGWDEKNLICYVFDYCCINNDFMFTK